MSSGTVSSREPDASLAVVREPRSGRGLDRAAGGRRVVVVLGMHRSGTSLLSNLLHYLGVDMADATDRVSQRNARGFWERPELNDLQDEVLAAIGRPIMSPDHNLPFPPAWWRRKEVQAIKPRLVAAVASGLAGSAGPWGFKDPRTCRLLPLWWEIFRELDLSPIYVFAIRSPAESAISMSLKNPARAISANQGELMWLAYNYDILRYVALDQPTLTVAYDEWFADGAAVARRLADALGLGGDFSDEDLRDCVDSVVTADLRNHVAGRGDAVSRMPIASLLYDAVIAEQPPGSAGLRALKNQMSFIGLLMKSVAPIVAELVPLAQSHEAAAKIDAERVERIVALDEQVATLNRKLLRARTDAETMRAAADVAGRLDALDTRIAEIIAGDVGQRVRQIDKRMRDIHGEFPTRIDRIDARLATLADDDAVKARLAAIETGLGVLATSEALDARLDGMSAQLAVLVEAPAAADRTAEVKAEAQRLAAETARLASRLERLGGRVHRVIAAARRDRAALVEQRRLADAHLGDVRRSGDRLATEIGRRRRIALALTERDERIAALEARPVAPAVAVARTGTYARAGEMTGADHGFAGGIDRVDQRGIAGWVRLADRPDLTPIVELAVNGSFVLAQACVAAGDRHVFSIDWRDVPSGHGGRPAIVRVAGIERRIEGPELIVPTRHDLHQLPANLAAELFGGSVTQAETYHAWLAAHGEDTALDAARSWLAAGDRDWPLISIILFGGDGADGAAATIRALSAQLYPHWEALCVDAPATLAAIDPRVRIVPAGTPLQAAAGGDLVSFVEAGDLIARTALLHLAAAADRRQDFALIYSDEDRIDPLSGVRGAPIMKGGWSDDLALVCDYATRLALVRRERLPVDDRPLDRDAVRRIVTAAAAAAPAAVVHLPFVLYHRAGDVDPAPDPRAILAALGGALPARLAGVKVADGARLRWPLPAPPPRVSLVVPTRDRVDLLRVCVDGLLHRTNYPDIEVLIADNDSAEPETHAYFAELAADPRVRVIACPGPFDYSAINNRAAAAATGSLIGLVNNDLAIARGDWLRLMVENALRPDIGIVGAKLLYGDDTVQHAGVVLGIGIASHLYRRFAADAVVPGDRLNLTQDVSAVTAACLVMRRAVWDEVGGLDTDFPVAYNDIDLCLRVAAAGYRILWSADAVVYHLESQSRGKDEAEKRERLLADQRRMAERWGDAVVADRFYSPNLAVTHVDGRLAFPPRAQASWQVAAGAAPPA